MMKRFNALSYASVFAFSIVLAACGNKSQQEAPPALPVSVLEVSEQQVPLLIETPGTTAGSLEVEVRPRVSGILQRKLYMEGALVKKGQPLFILDTDSAQETLKVAKAQVTLQAALLKQAGNNKERITRLESQNALSKRELEDAVASYNTAKASYDAALAQAKNAGLNVEYGTIVAPVSGYTSSEVLSVGSLVSPQNILTKISQTNPMYVNFSVSDSDLLKFKAANASGAVSIVDEDPNKVSLLLSDGTQYPIKGKVNFTDKIITEATGTVRIRAVFDNPNGQLFPGAFLRVQLKGAVRNNAIIIPQRSVVSNIQGKSVWVVAEDNTFASRSIKTADNVDKNVVVTDGLKAGDHVILDNILKLAQMPPKSKIEPKIVTLDDFYKGLAEQATAKAGSAEAEPAKAEKP